MKTWDITPPPRWSWTDDDWRMYNFFKKLDCCGGVLSDVFFDRYVLLKYDAKHPAKSMITFEDVLKYKPGSMAEAIICLQINARKFAAVGGLLKLKGPIIV